MGSYHSSAPGADQVGLRALIIATSADDFQLRAWQRILERIEMPYDVLATDREVLDRSVLFRPDGTGRYCAFLLCSTALLREDNDSWESAFDAAAWELLWQYQADLRVRLVVLNAAPGPVHDLGLELVGEGPIDVGAHRLELTDAGARVFDYLRPDARLPLTDAYLYRCRITSTSRTGNASRVPTTTSEPVVEPMLRLGEDVVGAISTWPDGRQSAAVCFTVGAGQLLEEMLGYGLLRWACRGVLLGEQQHWFNVDIDDWYDLGAGAIVRRPAHAHASHGRDPGSRIEGGLEVLADLQAQLQLRHPLAVDFSFTLAYNAGGAAPRSPDRLPAGGLTHVFRWVNHTMRHEHMELSSYRESFDDIRDNLIAASEWGLDVDPAVLKTPSYSGLGVVAGGEGGAADTYVDRGLDAANPRMVQAAHDLGVRFIHGNMSFASHHPPCFSGGLALPMRPDVTLVPDWPCAVPWWAETPEDVVRTGEDVGAPLGAVADRYERFVEAEAEVGFRHITSGSMYAHTLHRPNAVEYTPGHSLATDWVQRVLRRYEEYFCLPLRSPNWRELAEHVLVRTHHHHALRDGVDAVWDRVRNVVALSCPKPATVLVVGAHGASTHDGRVRSSTHRHGGDVITSVQLPAGRTVELAVKGSE